MSGQKVPKKRGMVQRKDGEMRHVSTYVRPELFRALRDYAEDHGEPVSDVVAEAIERFLGGGR